MERCPYVSQAESFVFGIEFWTFPNEIFLITKEFSGNMLSHFFLQKICYFLLISRNTFNANEFLRSSIIVHSKRRKLCRYFFKIGKTQRTVTQTDTIAIVFSKIFPGNRRNTCLFYHFKTNFPSQS